MHYSPRTKNSGFALERGYRKERRERALIRQKRKPLPPLLFSPLTDLHLANVPNGFLPAALAEAGLEITFKVGPKVLAEEVSDICPPPPPNLAEEVETLVHSTAKLWRGR